jgi:hypothetical protein
MSPQHILEIQALLELPPIRKWSSNLLETNILKLNLRGFTMLPLMGGRTLISIGAAIRKGGH